ncbi:MAG: aldo/keto reductase [Pseudomonadales bacterium]
MDRRKFLELGAVTTGLLSLGHSPLAGSVTTDHSKARVIRYGTLGRTGIQISDISFGSSRLRTGQEDLVRHALDKGVNYFDTADSYTRGQSEKVIGNALQDVRDRITIVSKTQVRADTDRDAIMRALEESLRRLKTDYVDVFFNHAVNAVDRLINPEWYEFAERARRQGKIRFTGMSGHAGRLVEVLDHAVAEDLIDVMLVSYNFGQDPAFYESLTRSFDRIATQTGLPAVLARAKQKDIGVVAMKTLMGARLNDMRAYEAAGATFAQAAFRWTLSNPNVDALIISMTSAEQIDEYLGASGTTRMSQTDLNLLHRYVTLNGATYCRQACNDCAGACPYDVPIADVLRTRMYATDYKDVEFARLEYGALEVNAAACLDCSGKPCQSACSHGLDVSGLCAPTHRMLA